MILPLGLGIAESLSRCVVESCWTRLVRVKLANDASGIANDYGEGRNVNRHHRACPDHRAFADRDTGKNARIETDPNVSPDAYGLRGNYGFRAAQLTRGHEF